jgi:hypothetical protein
VGVEACGGIVGALGAEVVGLRLGGCGMGVWRGEVGG